MTNSERRAGMGNPEQSLSALQTQLAAEVANAISCSPGQIEKLNLQLEPLESLIRWNTWPGTRRRIARSPFGSVLVFMSEQEPAPKVLTFYNTIWPKPSSGDENVLAELFASLSCGGTSNQYSLRILDGEEGTRLEADHSWQTRDGSGDNSTSGNRGWIVGQEAGISQFDGSIYTPQDISGMHAILVTRGLAARFNKLSQDAKGEYFNKEVYVLDNRE